MRRTAANGGHCAIALSTETRMKKNTPQAASILATTDKFIAAVPWGDWRVVLVFRREHGGRTYVRVRTWNLHRTKSVWYPTKRFYVIPIEEVDALAAALRAAARDEPLAEKPRWYAAREKADQERYEESLDLGALDTILEKLEREIRNRRQS